MDTTPEREDLLAIVADQRKNFLFTIDGINDEQAAARTTVSELTLGGLLKHLGGVHRAWLAVIDGSAPAVIEMTDLDPDQNKFTPTDTLAGLADEFKVVSAEFDRVVREEPDLDARVTLPRYPWSPPEPEVWTVRRVLLHIFRETAHHSGHADIIREALDGASTTARMAEAAQQGR